MAREADAAFKAWFDRIVATTIAVGGKIIGQGNEHVPMLQVHKDDGSEPMIIAIPWFGPEARDITAHFQKMAAAEPTVAGAVLISESWIVSGDKAEVDKVDMTKSIADHPDRKECMIVNALRGDMQLLALIPIERPANTLGKPEIIDPNAPGQYLVGRFAQDHDIH